MAIKFYVDIDKILTRKEMTLTELAKKSGINKGNLSKIRSSHRVNLTTLNKLASALNETDLDGLVSAEIEGTITQ